MSVGHLTINRAMILTMAIIGPRMNLIGFGFNSFQKRIKANSEINDAMISIILHDSCLTSITIPEPKKPPNTKIQSAIPIIFTIFSLRNLSNNYDFLDHPKYPSSSGSLT